MTPIKTLISAARLHAISLRKAASGDATDYGAYATIIEAERWERLADEAESERTQPHPAIDARVREALVEALGCFEAAYAEGLVDVMAAQESTDVGSLHDLVERRILYALPAIQRAIESLSSTPQAVAVGEISYDINEKGTIILPNEAPFDDKSYLIKFASGWCEAWWCDERDLFCWICMDDDFQRELDDAKAWAPLPSTLSQPLADGEGK